MDNLDRINEILQCVGRIWSECPVENEQVRDDLCAIVDNIQMIKAELLELWSHQNKLSEIDLIDRDALKAKIYGDYDRCHDVLEFIACILLRIEDAPTIKPEEDQSDG